VVVFGDPDNGDEVGTLSDSILFNDCHKDDIVCTGSGGYTTHLTYGDDAGEASDFIVKVSGLS
jgi:hypothetical protein